MNWAWLPGVGLGPFRFGCALPDPAGAFRLEDLGWGADGTGWESFGVEGEGITVHVAAGEVIAVECWQRIDYGGQNLVGLGLVEVKELFGDQLALSFELGEAQGLDVDQLGLALWLEAGSVESVSVKAL